MDAEELIEELTLAIRDRRVVRLAYARQTDGVLSLHYIAPIDLRFGETPRTRSTTYLWAFCLDEDKLETHLVDRIRKVDRTNRHFSPADLLREWPDNWPRPPEWRIPREW